MIPMPSDCAWRGPVISAGTPLMEISPESRGTAPLMIFIRVDLPAPFSPSSTCTSPATNSKSTPSSAITPGNVFRIPRSASTGVVESLILEQHPPLAHRRRDQAKQMGKRGRDVIDAHALNIRTRLHADAEPQ